jgi:hypothetical protein
LLSNSSVASEMMYKTFQQISLKMGQCLATSCGGGHLEYIEKSLKKNNPTIVYRKRITDDEQKVMAIYYVALSLARQVKNISVQKI